MPARERGAAGEEGAAELLHARAVRGGGPDERSSTPAHLRPEPLGRAPTAHLVAQGAGRVRARAAARRPRARTTAATRSERRRQRPRTASPPSATRSTTGQVDADSHRPPARRRASCRSTRSTSCIDLRRDARPRAASVLPAVPGGDLQHALGDAPTSSPSPPLTRGRAGEADFQTIEARMTEGHPCFVANSGRLGFGVAEYLRYAPEAAEPVRLRVGRRPPRRARRSPRPPGSTTRRYFAGELGLGDARALRLQDGGARPRPRRLPT